MAFDMMDVFVKIGADTSGLKQGIDESKGMVENAGGSFASGLGKVVSGGLQLVGKAVTGATAAVGAFAASSVQVGSSFDSSMAQVAATMGVTVDEIGELRDFAMDMGAKSSFSAGQAADALNYMALAGYDATQSMEMLPNVLNLAAAGGIELSRASDMVTDAQSALGLTAEETTELVDMMAKASSKSNTSVEQLGDAILTVGGTAKTLAGGTNELNTALGILADNGIKGSEGGTKLRNVILSLSAPTDNAAAALESLGIQTVDTEGNLRPLEQIMGELGDSMDGLGTADRAEIISTIFNKTDIAAVNALLDTSAERWDELSEAIDDSTGAAEQMASTQLDNLAGDVTLFKSALEGAQILVSDQLTPTLRDFVKFGTDGLTQISDAFKEGGLSGAMEAFGEVLSEGLNMIIGELPMMIDAGMQLLGALGQGILDNLPVMIDAAIQIINQILTGIVQALPSLAEGAIQILTGLANGIAEMLPTLIPTIVQVVLQIVQTLVENIPLLLEAGMKLLQGLGEGLIASIPVIIDMIPNIIDSLVKALVNGLPQLILGGVKLLEGIANALPTIIQSLINALPKVIDAVVKGLMSALPALIQGHIQMTLALVKAMPQIIKALINAIPTIVDTVVSTLIDNMPIIIEGLVEMTAMIVTALPQIIMAIIQIIPSLVSSIASAILAVASTIINAVGQILSQVGQALVQKGSEFVSTTGEKMSELYNKVIEWLGKLPERMAYWAGYAAASFIKFIAELPGKVRTEFNNVMTNVRSFATEFVNKAKEMAKDFFESIVNKVQELPGKMQQFGTDLLNAIKGLPDQFKSIGSDIVSGIWNGISGGWDWLVGEVGNLAKSLYQGAKDALGIKSPSKKFMFIGEMMDKGLASGINQSLPDVRRAMEGLNGVVDAPNLSANYSVVGSADAINSGFSTASMYESDSLFVSDMVDAFVKALDRYGLTVEVDNRELGRVVRREVLA